MLKYLKEAFWASPHMPGLGHVPVNALAVAAFGIFGFAESWIWLVGLGLETAYLYACFTSERFRRLVDAKELVLESAEATKKKTELVANLSRGRAVMDEVCSDLQRLEARVELALENARMGRGTEIIATEIDMNRPFLEDNLSDFTSASASYGATGLGAENTEPMKTSDFQPPTANP